MLSISSTNVIKKLYIKNRNISYINPLCQIALYIGLIPPYPVPKISKTSLFYKFYAIFIIGLLTYSCCYAVFVLADHSDNYSTTIMCVADILSFILMTTSTCIIILKSSLCNIQKHETFRKCFEKFDVTIKENLESPFRLYIQILFSHLTFLGFTAFCIVFSVRKFGWLASITHIHKFFEHYFNVIMVMLICNYVTSLKMRFEIINQRLTKTSNSEKNCAWKNVYDIRKFHYHLIDLTKQFNDIFGWDIFFLVIVVSIGLLGTVNSIITILYMENVIKSHLFIEHFVFVIGWCILLGVSVI